MADKEIRVDEQAVGYFTPINQLSEKIIAANLRSGRQDYRNNAVYPGPRENSFNHNIVLRLVQEIDLMMANYAASNGDVSYTKRLTTEEIQKQLDVDYPYEERSNNGFYMLPDTVDQVVQQSVASIRSFLRQFLEPQDLSLIHI